MSAIFVDVTQLSVWPGKLTGIPRVMNELSRRFSSEDAATLVVWKQGMFRKVVYTDLLEENRMKPVATASAVAPATASLKRLVHAAERRASPKLITARQQLQQVFRSWQQSTVASQSEGVHIQKGDIFVSLWGVWGDQSYIDALVKLHTQGVQLVEVIYDMLPLVTPQYSGHSTVPLENYATSIYPRCAQLLAISECSKRDADTWLRARRLRVPPIHVFRLGEDFHFSKAEAPKDEAFTAAKPAKSGYILCLGTIEARKNHTLLYYVYKLAAQRAVKLPKLVLVGRRGWLTDDIFTLMTMDPETRDQFVLLQNISDEELSWLFEHCLFTIYPSFYEGWGLPIAESLARGVPCIASNTSSMPEIAGNLIDYFSPVSVDECLAAIVHMLQPKALTAAKNKTKQYTATSWDDTFKVVSAHIKELLV